MKSKIILSIVLFTAIICGLMFILTKESTDVNDSYQNSESKIVNPLASNEQVFDSSKFSLSEPSSIWFIANKQYSLPLNYVPESLVVLDVPLRLAASEQQMRISEVVAEDLSRLFIDGNSAGLQLEFGSGYRSVALQEQFYSSYVMQDGQAAADTYSARPGHSEHQTGLALDFTRQDALCHLEACFGDTAEGKWLSENAHKYGFVLRYPENLDTITGYTYEPWHFRYVGIELATELKKQNIQTLEEFFKLDPAPSYLN